MDPAASTRPVDRLAAPRWAARIWAAAALLLWGAFFVAHVREWILRPGPLPPPRVLAMVALHGAMLLGLLLGWRYELAGGVLTLIASAAFFGQAAKPADAPIFLASTAIPALAWIACALASRRNDRGRALG